MALSPARCAFVLAFLTTACAKQNLCPPGQVPASTANSQATVQDSGAVVGQRVLGPNLAAFALNGSDPEKGAVKPVRVDKQVFTEALHAQTLQATGSVWSVQLQAPTIAPVEQGDVLLATFYVRAVAGTDPGRADTEFVFERAGAPWTKSVNYAVPVRSEWRKVQVPFTAAESYPAGGANVIFRLGYEPQTIEIAAVSVENFGKKMRRWSLPSTEAAEKKLLAEPYVEAPITVGDGGDLVFTVTPTQVLGPISPLVYGLNAQKAEGTGATVRRMGGNRQSAYNWELNASSAGSDWEHVNDDWPCTVLGYKNCAEPGAQVSNFVADNKRSKLETIITVPLLDWVSADKRGAVAESEKAPSARFVRSLLQKPGPLVLAPQLDDAAVYQDELVHFLVRKHGTAAQGGAEFYALDNEPALWSHTHPRVHAEKTTYEEMARRSEAAAAMITKQDPTAKVLGGVMFGWSEFTSLSDAPDSKQYNDRYGTYVDFLLATMKEAEQRHGRRLMHVLDVHWYPEARGRTRVTEADVSQKTIDARLLAPRSLWDGAHLEKSWIGSQLKKPIRLIPWLKERIAERYPGTKLSMTEYNFGAGQHISGGLAQADVLGILGREGVFMANYWGEGAANGDLPPFIRAAFQLFRNYDGKGGMFGDSAVQASVAQLDKASIYAATDSKRPGVLTVLVLNKDQRARYTGALRVEGASRYAAAEVFVLDGTAPSIRTEKPIAVSNNTLRVNLPALSATLLILRAR
ncbi:MAG TPA: glycoside hydrolase family 44 protein [Polyangiaceae bacterium]